MLMMTRDGVSELAGVMDKKSYILSKNGRSVKLY